MSGLVDLGLESVGDALVARVSGEVDLSNAALVREEISSAVPNDASRLVLDLARVRYLDSAGVELLFELARRLLRRRQDLQLVLPADSPVDRTLEVCGVAAVAPVHRTLEAALASAPGQR